MSRNYDSISPSALSLLKMKGHTTLPFAREAAALLEKHGISALAENQQEQLYYWMRVFHFEARYVSINNLLEDIRPRNILELSSGYSFRGLDYCMKHDAHYIDTDLPEVIGLKTSLQKELAGDHPVLKGTLETLALNALDEPAFDAIVARFSGEAFTVVNEGLLMYLNTEEKKQLCSILHRHLSKNGGYWITADIYIKSPETSVRNLRMSKEEEAFFTKHNIDENKFESEEAAEEFFKSQGFVIEKAATLDVPALSSFGKLLEHIPEEVKNQHRPMPRVQITWRLKAV